MAKPAIKTMQQMEQENRRLLQEEADKKALAKQQSEEVERQKSLQGESERNKDEQEAGQKRLAEQQQREKEALHLEAEHQRQIDAAADLQQREQVASISGTPLPQQQQRAPDLELRPAAVVAKDQGEYHVRNATGDGSLGAFVVRGSGNLDHASKQDFLRKQAAEQEQQKQADNELEY
jgi:hypothetical protein